MNKSLVVALVLFHVAFLSAFSQNSYSEYKRAYDAAVQMYANSNYQGAVQAFLPLTSERYKNPLVPYSHYYVALSSNNLGNYYQSKLILDQLFSRYPDWPKMDEAYYLYAEADFNEKKYDEALSYDNRIQQPSIKRVLPDMEYKYLSQITDISTLKALNSKYPTNRMVAELLVKAIRNKSIPTREELRLSDQLTNRFKFSTNPSGDDFEREYDDKNIDIGVLLPFNLSENQTSPRLTYAYDMMIGMELAAQKLNADGIPVKVYGYDINNSAEKMSSLTGNKDFKQLDVFVGPVYPTPNDIASSYAQKNKIIQIHPISNNADLIDDGPGTYLAQPSYADLSNKALEFAQDLNNNAKTVAIYYGTSKKDSLFAEIYARQALQNGFSVLEKNRFSSYEDIRSGLNTNHVFVAAMPAEITNMIRSIRRQKNNSPIITGASSFNFSTVPNSILSQNVYILYPEYIDVEKTEVTFFRDLYINKIGDLPTYYAYLGYDLAMYFGRMLKNGKENFRQSLNLIEYTQGYTLSGFDYTNNKHSNQLIPIVKYQNGKLQEITR